MCLSPLPSPCETFCGPSSDSAVAALPSLPTLPASPPRSRASTSRGFGPGFLRTASGTGFSSGRKDGVRVSCCPPGAGAGSEAFSDAVLEVSSSSRSSDLPALAGLAMPTFFAEVSAAAVVSRCSTNGFSSPGVARLRASSGSVESRRVSHKEVGPVGLEEIPMLPAS